MKTKVMIRSVFFLYALLSPTLVFSADISGLWKNAKQPAWIKVNLEEGSATEVRNDKSPERVGTLFLKDIKVDDSKSTVWQGAVYARKLGGYKDVKISLVDTENMLITGKIGFFSRTIEWLREDDVSSISHIAFGGAHE